MADTTTATMVVKVKTGETPPLELIRSMGPGWTCQHDVHPSACSICCGTRTEPEYDDFRWEEYAFDSEDIDEPETDTVKAKRRARRLEYNEAIVAAARNDSPLLRRLINVRLQDLARVSDTNGITVNLAMRLLARRECVALLMFGKSWIVESLANNRRFSLAQLDEYYRTTLAGHNLGRTVEK